MFIDRHFVLCVFIESSLRYVSDCNKEATLYLGIALYALYKFTTYAYLLIGLLKQV